jgi:crossover junction endodeoxyribonuclease RusA
LNCITLKGEPKSTQHIYWNTCRGGLATTYMTAEDKAIKEAYQWEGKSQWKNAITADAVAVSVRFYFATKRKRDLDNQNKLVLDALTGIVYVDDSQVDELHLYRHYDKENPRIEVQVEELTP